MTRLKTPDILADLLGSQTPSEPLKKLPKENQKILDEIRASFFTSEDESEIPDQISNSFFIEHLEKVKSDSYSVTRFFYSEHGDDSQTLQIMSLIERNYQIILETNRLNYWGMQSLENKTHERRFAVLTMFWIYKSIKNLEKDIDQLAEALSLIGDTEIYNAGKNLGKFIAKTVHLFKLWKDYINKKYHLSREEIHTILEECMQFE